MIKVTLLVACALVGVQSGVVPAIPQQYLQYQAAAPQLPPQLAGQVRALPAPLFRSAAPAAQPLYAQQSAQQLQAAQQYQPAPQQYAAAPQQQYQPAPQPRPQAAPANVRRLPAAAAGQQPLTEEDYDPSPEYNFSFDVKDDQFTNYQNRKEQREGDKISGSYSVVDSDGFIRTVTYTADPVGGFKAEVIREPTDIKVIVPTPTPQTAGGPQYATRAGQQQAYAPQPAPARAAPQQYAPAPQQQYAPAPQQYAPQPAQVRVAPKPYAPQPLQYQG